MLIRLKNTLQILAGAVLAAQLTGCIFVDHDHDHYYHHPHPVYYAHPDVVDVRVHD